MASDDIAVPDLAYYIENDLRAAIRQMDEDGPHPYSIGFDALFSTSALSTSPANPQSSPVPPVESKIKKARKKKKKATGSTVGSKTVRKFPTPYAVFLDNRKQAERAAHPDKKVADICKQIAREWERMTRLERAPYKKEFEDRRRLYELENPGSVIHKGDRKARQGRKHTFRFAPHRSNKENQISRISSTFHTARLLPSVESMRRQR
ncbi:hypothetical protein P389DRAFT_70055 [Cystobasidium minutum MCA 4210]|uniref:uncharacterized protein n=1 Tax=Cystobasidium minutum MCA 4210 TaxID=1397322 RepID=UPI0034CD72F2|eukprot:jgi/Rhomi1/70055/CE70054_109